MKFEVQRDDMRTLLRNVTRAINTKSEREILSNAIVSIDEDKKLRLGCTDTETTITAQIQLVNVEEIGDVTIPGLRLFEIFGSIASGSDTAVEAGENSVVISSPGKRFQLSTLPPEQLKNTLLSTRPRGDSITRVKMPLKRFRSMLTRTAFAMGRDQTRAYLNGVLFELSTEHMRMVATNGVAMAVHTYKDSELEGDEVKIIVPNRAIDELMHLMSEAQVQFDNDENTEEDVELVITDRRMLSVIREPFQLDTNLIDSSFPQYESVIPEDTEQGFTCGTNDLLDAIRSAVICATQNNHAIKVELQKDLLNLNSSNERGDSAGIQLPVETESEVMFTVDGARFDTLLRHVVAETVKVHVPEEKTAANNLKIQGIGEEDACFVIARMRN
ncbi:MAG: DNA polymerase III subunit beta [Gammaproteobacteria bacterium]|nr:DNA polymerase III subunit beta [Gammaproteobacteria bacterium]